MCQALRALMHYCIESLNHSYGKHTFGICIVEKRKLKLQGGDSLEIMSLIRAMLDWNSCYLDGQSGNYLTL